MRKASIQVWCWVEGIFCRRGGYITRCDTYLLDTGEISGVRLTEVFFTGTSNRHNLNIGVSIVSVQTQSLTRSLRKRIKLLTPDSSLFAMVFNQECWHRAFHSPSCAMFDRTLTNSESLASSMSYARLLNWRISECSDPSLLSELNGMKTLSTTFSASWTTSEASCKSFMCS